MGEIFYRINREERLVTMRFTGVVPMEDSKRVFAQVMSEFPECATFDSVNDLRDQESALRTEQVREMGDFSKKLGLHDHERRSVALVRSKVHFGVSRMFEQMTEHESKVQRLTTESVEAAAQWLGRPVETIQAELAAVAALQTYHR